MKEGGNLKIRFFLYADDVSVDRMAEFYILGMKIESVRFLAIKFVSKNGTVQSFRMGGMYT